MSLITDALKRAERDRGQKLREKVEEVHAASVAQEAHPPRILEEEEVLVEQKLKSAVPPVWPSSETAFKPQMPSLIWPQFSWRTANVFVLRGAFVVSLAALVVFLFMIFKWEPPEQTTVASVSLPALSRPSGVSTVPVSKKGFFQKHAPARPGQAFSYALSGISTFDDKHYAIINGLVLQAGDSVDGAMVKDITDREAILETRAGELKLRIPV